MRAMRKLTYLLPLLALLSGCGPHVAEVRMAAAPPRPENCELEFLQLQVMDLSPMGGKYEQLGSVVLMQRGVQDPFQPEYKAIVRPRACAMGGEGVTILQQATGTSAFGASGTGINYAIVRKRPPPGSAPPPPSKF